MNHSEILEILIREQDPKKAASSLRFFKTGRGEYGEGDKFLGFTVADIRGLVKRYGKELTLTDLEELLKSEWHEARHFALLVMVKRAAGELEAVYDLFIRNVERVNNWDIVDISSPYISGAYWYKSGDCTTLWEFANSGNLWKERIAVVSSFYNIRAHKQTDLTFELAEHFIRRYYNAFCSCFAEPLRSCRASASTLFAGEESVDEFMPANNPPTGSGFCSCLPKPPRNCRVSLPVPKGQRGETALAKELKTRDLIHKAVGWSLREAGKANENALLTFLDRYAVFMPRTMLRYSLERLVPDKRKHYMLLK